jgi:hypothetical protein
MSELFEVQKWFGAMIAQPMQTNQLLPPLSPFGTDTVCEAEKYIAPSPTLAPYERVQIYHQQYWWRLLKCLQKNFPTLSRLFGEEDFQNHIAIPYLAEEPPSHWSLCRLGETLSRWLERHYREEDRYLVITAAEIDRAADEAFWIGALPQIDFATLSTEQTLCKRLFLQPHLHLFSLQGDFFTFRDEFLKQEVAYYNTHPFPEMVYGEYHFVLYRTPKNVVSWKQLSYPEYWVLSQFKEGETIEKVVQKIETKGGDVLEKALSQIPFWFKQWTVLEWFGS